MQILCATDFSEPAARAADAAAGIAKALRLPLRLVHCIADWPLMVEPMLLLNDHFSNTWRQQLDAEVVRLAGNGIEVNSDLRRGDASHELIAATIEHPAAMIVMGSTGAGRAERWLLGRVAERVAEGAAVPALVVRHAEPLLSWLAGEKALRVLCGVDFNLSSDAALTTMRDFSGLGKLEVEAVHVREAKRRGFMGFGGGASQPEEEDQASSEADVGRDVWDRVNEVLGQPPVHVHVPRASKHADHEMARLADEREAGLMVVEVLFHDDTAEAISSAAEKFGADVICMGTRGHSRAGVAIAGSVMQAVTAKCHRPVFVVPPPVA